MKGPTETGDHYRRPIIRQQVERHWAGRTEGQILSGSGLTGAMPAAQIPSRPILIFRTNYMNRFAAWMLTKTLLRNTAPHKTRNPLPDQPRKAILRVEKLEDRAAADCTVGGVAVAGALLPEDLDTGAPALVFNEPGPVADHGQSVRPSVSIAPIAVPEDEQQMARPASAMIGWAPSDLPDEELISFPIPNFSIAVVDLPTQASAGAGSSGDSTTGALPAAFGPTGGMMTAPAAPTVSEK